MKVLIPTLEGANLAEATLFYREMHSPFTHKGRTVWINEGVNQGLTLEYCGCNVGIDHSTSQAKVLTFKSVELAKDFLSRISDDVWERVLNSEGVTAEKRLEELTGGTIIIPLLYGLI